MAREGLRYELAGAFQKALQAEGRRHPEGAEGANQRRRAGRGHHRPAARGAGGAPGDGDDRLRGRGRAARSEGAAGIRADRRSQRRGWRSWSRSSGQAREELQTTREEMQTSQEELKSTNEELQSTNEELQSTNEELTTSKEEMQSMNEELQTVNHELQAKVDELSRANNDMKNLLDSTDIATLFLDDDLNVRRFTSQTTKIIKLIPGDAGRPITDIASDLVYPELAEDAREVLRTLVFKEATVAAAGRALVSGAHHALPHPGEPDRRRGDHLHGHHRLQDAGDRAAQDAGRTGTARHRQDDGTGPGPQGSSGRKSDGATERTKGTR